MSDNNNKNELECIAIIGMAGRFPGADNVETFWNNLCNGIESITYFKDEELDPSVAPTLISNKNYIKAKPIINDIELFDAEFFKFSPREAQIMDPQIRVFLETAWQALEKAGYVPGTTETKIGIFAGSGYNAYYAHNIAGRDELNETFGFFEALLLNEKDFFSTQVSYKLNLTGPSINVNTGCSTSLVAVSLAFDSLLSYQCDIALAGGATIFSPQNIGYLYQEGNIDSSDGHCRPFDSKASGTVFGNGVGIVVMKRLSDAIEDGDFIYAVIKGCGLNNDGSKKMSFTAPSVDGQAEAITMAQANAGISADMISYIETHGTATPLGDPVEVAAMTQAFRAQTDKKQFCAIGSIKGNIGHLDSAAGVIGLMKTALSLHHKVIPPSINFKEPNPKIDFNNSPFFVNTELREWHSDGLPRTAGVSSMGIGGTNAHIILEEAPLLEASGPSRARQPLLFSARTEKALNTAIANMATHLERNPELNLADVAFTLQLGRRAFAHRGTVVCHDVDDAIAALRATDPKRVISTICETGHRDVVFMFSGQGSQYANMGLDLYKDEPVFREQIDYCAEILQREILVDLRQLLYPAQDQIEEAEERLKQTSITQPALFAIEFALAKLWMSWGIHPKALVGHSIGEYTAACLAEVFSLEDALKLVATRGRLMQEMPPGCMLAVFLPEEQLAPFMNDDLSLSVINSPSLCVVSGEGSVIDGLENSLAEKQVTCRRLHTSHAFHSKMMDPILAPFAEQIKQVGLMPPKIPFLSNVTGTWITQEEATDPNYWVRHLRGTVRFADCIQELFREPNRVLLEVGPGLTLSTLANQHPAKEKNHIILSSTRLPKKQQSDSAFILDTLCALWRAGVPIDWMAFHAGTKRRRVPLPTYPFERKRFWLSDNERPIKKLHKTNTMLATDSVDASSKITAAQDEKTKESYDLTSRSSVEQILIDIWKEILGVSDVKRNDDFFALGGHSLVAIRLFSRIENICGKRLPLATLLSAPTIEQLADIITQKDFAPAWTSLVKIRAEGTKPPFFLIHSEGGNVLEYIKLANYLDQKIPIYGLQSSGLKGDKIVSMSIEEMARQYIAEIKMIQPKGPYFIGGYCLGGLISFEMARQWEAMGEKIGLLALISTFTPDHLNKEIPKITTAQRLLYSVLERSELEIDNLSALQANEKFLYIGDRIRRTELMVRVIYENFADFLSKALHLKPFKHSRRYFLEQTRMEQSKAFYTFKPTPIKARVNIFRTSKQPRSLIPDPTLGWANLSEGGILDIEVRAFHKNILKDPNVKALAKKLQEYLDATHRAASQ